MSNATNEMLLENWFEEFLAEGFSEAEAERLANEKLENTPAPWGLGYGKIYESGTPRNDH